MPDFASFFSRTRHSVFRTVYAAGGSRARAEDAVAEAYARAYQRWTTVGEHPNPTAWVLRTALNEYRSVGRRLRRERLADVLPDGRVEAPGPALDDQLRTAVRALPRRRPGSCSAWPRRPSTSTSTAR
jgi:RNA polymerase sigma-70 factor (ECF subfamily)